MLSYIKTQLQAAWRLMMNDADAVHLVDTGKYGILFSLGAILLGDIVFAVSNYVYFPADQAAGLVPVGMSRTDYVFAGFWANLAGVIAAYAALAILAFLFDFRETFWRCFVASNWAYPLLSVLAGSIIFLVAILPEGEIWYWTQIILLLAALLLLFVAVFNLTLHSLAIGRAKTIFVVIILLAVQILMTEKISGEYGLPTFSTLMQG